MTTPKYVPPTYYPNTLKPPEPPKPVAPVTVPPGYYIDNYGNVLPIPLAPNPELYEQPKLPVYFPNFPPSEVAPSNVGTNIYPQPQQPTTYDPVAPTDISSDPYKQPPRSNPQNLQTDDIRSFVNANIGDPATIASAMQQYGLNATDVAQAMGVDPSIVTSYLGYGTSPQPNTSITPTQYTETPPTYLMPPTPLIPTYPPFDAPKEQPSTYYPAAPTPNPDISQLVTLPDGSQVYTGQ